MKDLFSDSLFFGMLLSLVAYEIGLLCKKYLKHGIFNPLLVAIVFVIGFLLFFRIDYAVYDEDARYLSYLLTPATVCLAVPLYRQIATLRQNPLAIAAGSLTGVLVSLGSIFLFSRLFGFDHTVYVTLLPKSITTAIGIGVSEELSGIVTISVAAIILTGILGNMTAAFLCQVFRIRDPIARGLAIGASAHAIGTVKALEMGEVEGAMSSLAIVVCGLLTVVLAPVFAGLI